MIEKFFSEYRYGGFTRMDGTLQLYARINALTKKSDTVVDLGCGRGKQIDDPSEYRRNLKILKGKCAKVIGLDVDPIGYENEHIDEFRLIETDRLPLEDESVDLVFSDWTLEHIQDPVQFFKEINRILKPNGYFALRTSNKLHYVSIAAMLIPNKWHGKVTGKVQKNRKAEDVFPTYFACNTKGRVRTTLKKSGLAGIVYLIDGEPSYLQFSRIAYSLGLILRALTPEYFRHTMLIFGHKDPS